MEEFGEIVDRGIAIWKVLEANFTNGFLSQVIARGNACGQQDWPSRQNPRERVV